MPTPITTSTPEAQSVPTDYPWVNDGLSGIEEKAPGYLEVARHRHPSIAAATANGPWLSNGIDGDDRLLRCHFATVD